MNGIKADILCALFLLSPLVCSGYYVINSDTYPQRPVHCGSGQSYWCKNITTAVECRALKHCIKGVWEKQVPIEKDTSSVCDTCIEMVKEARDQLESNETQAEIREVLEGTCKVIPVKLLRKDCDKVMDDFGSYLVDTLASEMNPQVVCSVAGLCNNPAYEQISNRELTCDSCFGLMRQVEDRIETASEQDLRRAFVGICRSLGTFSDGCSAFVLSHLPQIANHLQHIKAVPVCMLAGVCTEKFHFHAALMSAATGYDDGDVEVMLPQEDDDLPCDLCEQLVKHLRDVLVANTTVDEFKLVLIGLCNEFPTYKDECHAFVDTYYGTVYNFLVNELDGKVLCREIGICPSTEEDDAFIRPLLPAKVPATPAVQVDASYQLPESRYNPLTILPKAMLGKPKPESQMLCSFCEYFLHFVQQEITLPSSERKIKEAVENGCSRLPASVAEQCNSFFETYIDAFIALLADRIDPSQVCPGIGVCPGSLIVVEYNDKPTCPLCLLAMEEVLRKVSNRTEEDINDALDDLCIRDVFPNSLTTECAEFITSYREQLTDMILADFTAEEACLYSAVCVLPEEPEKKSTVSTKMNTVSGNSIDEEAPNPNACVLCEFVMTKLEKILKDKKTEEEIKEDVFKVCNYMPHTVTAQCKKFVEEYADLIIELLTNELSPKEMCTALNLCSKAVSLIRPSVRKCLTCEVLMESFKTIATDEDVDKDINYQLSIACLNLPQREINVCREIVLELGPQIESAIRTIPIGPIVCRRIGICGVPHCSLGPVYWCINEENAVMCQEQEFCRNNVWNKNKALVGGSSQTSHLKGTDVI